MRYSFCCFVLTIGFASSVLSANCLVYPDRSLGVVSYSGEEIKEMPKTVDDCSLLSVKSGSVIINYMTDNGVSNVMTLREGDVFSQPAKKSNSLIQLAAALRGDVRMVEGVSRLLDPSKRIANMPYGIVYPYKDQMMLSTLNVANVKYPAVLEIYDDSDAKVSSMKIVNPKQSYSLPIDKLKTGESYNWSLFSADKSHLDGDFTMATPDDISDVAGHIKELELRYSKQSVEFRLALVSLFNDYAFEFNRDLLIPMLVEGMKK
jgi:hypothetical protein